MLKRASSQAAMLRNSAFEGAVTEKLRVLLGGTGGQSNDRKAKREPPKNSTGRVMPTGSGRRHKKARNEQSGDTFGSSVNLSGIMFEWESKDDGLIGRADIPGNRIYLNEKHSRLAHHKEAENVDAIADLCCVVLMDEAIRNRESSKLSIVRDFSGLTAAISEVLRRQQESDEATGVAAEVSR
jgi:hypothetical protein